MEEKMDIYLLITNTVHYANTLHMLGFVCILYKSIDLYISVSKIFCQLLHYKKKKGKNPFRNGVKKYLIPP